MAKKQNKKNKAKKSNNQNKMVQKPEVVSADVRDDMEANEVVEAEVVEATAQAPVKEQKAKEQKKDKKAKKQAKKEPKPNKAKETVAELKKVTWPTFPKVVKNTLLVLGIVVLFTIVLFGIDYGLSWIYKLLTPAA